MLLALACLVAAQDGAQTEEEKTYTFVVHAKFPLHDIGKPFEDDPDCKRVAERMPKAYDKRVRFHMAQVATGDAKVTFIAPESLKPDPAKIRAAFEGYPVDRIDVSIAGRLSRDAKAAAWLTCRVSGLAVRLQNAPPTKSEPKPADVLSHVEKIIADGDTDVTLDAELVSVDNKLVFRLRKAPTPRK